MAKIRKNPFDGSLGKETDPHMDGNMDMSGLPGLPGLDLNELMPLVAKLGNREGMMLFSMIAELVEAGVTPERYAAFYSAYQKLRPMFVHDAAGGKTDAFDEDSDDMTESEFKDKTLLLKIQMKGVTKPPMWREVEVPADMTFLNLHHVIQRVMGFYDGHLWQFNERAYDEWVQIGIQSTGNFDSGLEYVTDDAAVTPLYDYLDEVGEKLEYVYDFGDDWIFTVSVKKILDRKCEYPVCTAFKGDLNPIEDTGGPWAYMTMRSDPADWKTLKKKEKAEIAEQAGFESADDYYAMLKDNLFNMDSVNESLKALNG